MATSHTLNEKVNGNGRDNGNHKNLYKKRLVSDSGLPATRKTFTCIKKIGNRGWV